MIGIPIQVIIGEKALKKSKIEVKHRHDKKVEQLEEKEAVKRIKGLL